nr:uncharacterized protein LOC129269986 [Lytechinus pictus]
MATTTSETLPTAPKDRSDSHSSCDSSCGVTTSSGSSNGSNAGSGSNSGSSSRKNSLTARTVGSKGSNGGKTSSGKKHSGEAYIEGDIKLRFLCPEDVEAVKQLCRDWFPVEYPDFWYKDITNDKRFFSLAAAIGSTIVGLLVAEVKTRARCHREVSKKDKSGIYI